MSNSEDIFAAAPPPKTPLQRYRILSPKASIRVSPIQLGGMSIGSAWTNQLGSMNKDQSFKMLDEYFNAGGNFIDTSSNYQNEESETWIGSWMAERQNREQIVLATKYTTDYRSHALGRGNAPNAVGNSKRNMFRSVEASLRKLQTDYLDILYLHWWDHVTSIEEVMDALHILVQQGKVLYLGISDSPAWVVSAANTYAIAHGKTPFVIYQGRWNVMTRDFERDVLPMARHFGLALAPWDVLGGGHFQTAKQIAQRKKDGEGLRPLRSSEQNEAEIKMSEALGVVASEHGIESVTAIALAYVLSKAPNVFPIVGGRKIEHLQDNIRAVEIRLTKKQIEYLESVQEFDIGFPGNFIGTDPRTNGGEGQRLAQTAGKVDFVLAPTAVGYEGRE